MAEHNPYDDLFSAEEMQSFNKILLKKWVRIDPKTKKPHTNSKDIFWEVDNMIPMSRAGADMNRPKMNFKVQAYWRRKTYEASTEGGSSKTVRHEAFNEVNSRGELVRPGYIIVEYDNFLTQFAEDK